MARFALTTLFILIAAPFAMAEDDAKVLKARREIETIERVLKVVYLKTAGAWPQRLKDTVPYFELGEKALIDPWGQPYQYDPKGLKNGGTKPDVWTVTPDNRVIGNWKDNPAGGVPRVEVSPVSEVCDPCPSVPVCTPLCRQRTGCFNSLVARLWPAGSRRCR